VGDLSVKREANTNGGEGAQALSSPITTMLGLGLVARRGRGLIRRIGTNDVIISGSESESSLSTVSEPSDASEDEDEDEEVTDISESSLWLSFLLERSSKRPRPRFLYRDARVSLCTSRKLRGRGLPFRCTGSLLQKCALCQH